LAHKLLVSPVFVAWELDNTSKYNFTKLIPIYPFQQLQKIIFKKNRADYPEASFLRRTGKSILPLRATRHAWRT
jgi:hypothetical protein